MTRRDYILITKAITDTQKRITLAESIPQAKRSEQLRGIRRTAAHLADALAQDNPRFDAQRFLTACGYGATSMNPRDPALDLRRLPTATMEERYDQLFDRGDSSDDSEPCWN